MLKAGLPFQRLGMQRRQVLEGLDNVCRLTFMAVPGFIEAWNRIYNAGENL